jgi:hypothetical protein
LLQNVCHVGDLGYVIYRLGFMLGCVCMCEVIVYVGCDASQKRWLLYPLSFVDPIDGASCKSTFQYVQWLQPCRKGSGSRASDRLRAQTCSSFSLFVRVLSTSCSYSIRPRLVKTQLYTPTVLYGSGKKASLVEKGPLPEEVPDGQRRICGNPLALGNCTRRRIKSGRRSGDVSDG